MKRSDFISSFTPEIDYYVRNPHPALTSLKKKLSQGESYFQVQGLEQSELQLAKALLMAPGAPAINTDKQVYTTADYQTLSAIVEILLNKDQDYIEEQRQEFNSVAISLRKQSRLEEAINFYQKALELNDEDENLHFNIARAYFEIGMNPQALMHIDRALAIDPTLETARLFQKYIMKNVSK